MILDRLFKKYKVSVEVEKKDDVPEVPEPKEEPTDYIALIGEAMIGLAIPAGVVGALLK